MSDESEDKDACGNDLITHTQLPAPNGTPFSPKLQPASHSKHHHLQELHAIQSTTIPDPVCDVSARSPNEPQETASLQGAQCPTPHGWPRRVADNPPLEAHSTPTKLESHTLAPPTSVPAVSPFTPAYSLATALRSVSPGISSNASIVGSSLPVVRPASAAPQSATSLPTPITLMLTRLPAPSVLSFTSGHHVDHQSSSPYPPPTGDLPAPPNGMHHMNASSLKVHQHHHQPALACYFSKWHCCCPKHELEPNKCPVLTTSSDTPTPTTTPPTIQVPFSQTPVTQWTVPQVIAWLQSKGFNAEIQCTFQENDITSDILIELDGLALKDELGVTAFGKWMWLLKQIGELKQEDEKAKEKEKLVIGSRWSGSSRPASAIGDNEDRLKVQPVG
ncbi:hypothetical protein FRC11_002062, partial [Ceratobasidium sp. 423]